LTSWAGVARIVRGEFLAQTQCDYVSAARAIGASNVRIIFRHILPNAIAPIIITATFGIAGAVLGESGLSFLGFGDPTTASWGLVLDEGRENISYAWLIYAPGIAIFLLVTSLNVIGNGLRDAFDPKSS
jgi:peptide/nickel transport system permease protein